MQGPPRTNFYSWNSLSDNISPLDSSVTHRGGKKFLGAQRFTELEESPGSLQARLIQRRRYIWKSVVVSGWHSRERARGHDRTSTSTVSCTLYGAASVHGGCWLGWGRLWGSKMSALQGIPTSPGEPSKTHHNWDGTKQNIPVFYMYVSLANVLPKHWSKKSRLIEAQLTRKVYIGDKLC